MAAFSAQDDDIVSDINVTPLVDVMLVLLVTFIVTIPALTRSVNVNLPKTAASTPSEQKTRTTVSIDAAGNLFIDKDPVASAEQVADLLARQKATSPDLVVQVKADEKTAYAPIAKVIGALEHAGVTHLSLLTAPE
jgi:biopolymer transport protein ExbD